MRIFITVICFFLFFGASVPTSAQDFVDPSVNVGQIPTSGTDRGQNSNGNNTQGARRYNTVLNPYDPKYRPLQGAKMEQEKQANNSGDVLQPLVSPSNFDIQFVRPANLTQNEIMLRISQGMVVSGCVDVLMPKPKISFNGVNMRVNVSAPTLALQGGMKRPDYECPKVSKTVSADIRLSLAALKKQGTRKIVFKSEFGQDKYDIDVGKYAVRLSASAPVLFKGHSHIGGRDPLTHIIYPQNTMMINAPMIPVRPAYLGVKQDRLYALSNFAARQNLTPLTQIVPQFNQTSTPPFFVVDKSGITFNTLNANEYTPIGEVTDTALWHGTNGAYSKNQRAEVLAKRPGFYD